jgi:choline-sulfatase
MKTTVMVLALLMLPCAVLRAAETARPNIVFFFSDDQTSDTLGCYGHPIIQTPNLDCAGVAWRAF